MVFQMIILKSRLEALQAYLTEALLKPIANHFYIEDLKLSIETEKQNPMDAQTYAKWVHA